MSPAAGTAAARPATAKHAPRRGHGPAKRPRPPLRVVRSPRPAPSRRALGLLGAVATLLVFTSLLGLAALHAVLVQGQLQADRLADALQAEQQRAVELRLRVAELESPTRVLREANRLGMVVPIERGWLVPVQPGDPEAPIPAPGPDPFAGPDAEAAAGAAPGGGGG
jgi:cell division protein FtsL